MYKIRTLSHRSKLKTLLNFIHILQKSCFLFFPSFCLSVLMKSNLNFTMFERNSLYISRSKRRAEKYFNILSRITHMCWNLKSAYFPKFSEKSAPFFIARARPKIEGKKKRTSKRGSTSEFRYPYNFWEKKKTLNNYNNSSKCGVFLPFFILKLFHTIWTVFALKR